MRRWLHGFFARRRHERAERIRQMIKREILFEDAKEFFAGKKTQEQSLRYRAEAYKYLDGLTDEQILAA